MDYFVQTRKDFEDALAAAQKGDVVIASEIHFYGDKKLSIVTPARVVIEGYAFWCSPESTKQLCSSEVV